MVSFFFYCSTSTLNSGCVVNTTLMKAIELETTTKVAAGIPETITPPITVGQE
jgi:hypothetical protein